MFFMDYSLMPIFENTYPAVVGDNPRAVKVNKLHNGKRSNVATMTGVSRSQLASMPSLRIGQNWLIEIDHGYVDLVMLGTATRLQRAILKDSTLGWTKQHSSDRYRARVGRVKDGKFERSHTFSLYQWHLLASRVFLSQQYPSVSALIERLDKAVSKAISLCPTLCLHRDRSDNPRYDTRLKPKCRAIAGDIRLTDKQPRPSTVRALAKRNA